MCLQSWSLSRNKTLRQVEELTAAVSKQVAPESKAQDNDAHVVKEQSAVLFPSQKTYLQKSLLPQSISSSDLKAEFQPSLFKWLKTPTSGKYFRTLMRR